MKKKFRKILNGVITLVIALTLLLVGGVGCFDGCNFSFGSGNGYEFSFKNESLNLIKGESYVFTSEDFSFSPQEPFSFPVTLTSTDDEIIEIKGKKVTALSEGSVTLTATADGKTATCVVSVSNEIESIALTTRTPSRAISENRETIVYAIINDDSRVKRDIRWEIDGVEKEYTGSEYTIAPSAVPKIVTLKATVKDSVGDEFSDEIKINWYDEFISKPVLSLAGGTLNHQKGDTSPVTFSLDYEISSTPIIEWFINGERVNNESESVFTLPALDKAGEYKISAKVNGVEATVPSGNDTVTVVGDRIPSNLKVDYDSFYPSIAVSWDEASENENFTVSFTDELGIEKTFETQGNFELINDISIDLLAHSYTVKVKSNGDENAFTASNYSNAVKINKITSLEKQYLTKTWHGGNYYLSSDEEFYEIYDYFLLYRLQPDTMQTRSEYTVYMGYKSKYTLDRLSTIAFNRAGYTGEYEIDALSNGNIVTLTFVFKTVSYPSVRNTSVLAKQLNGIKPHISETGREDDHVFFVDGLTKTAKVSTTDQLYRVVEMGFKPIIENNSSLQGYYDYAKKLLNSILDEEMNDLDKAHAIYDYIMWRVLYDEGVVGIAELNRAVKYAAFYLEGVLTDEYYYAVCDGMSKAYSLLCNMEGVPCVRITGTARSTTGTTGGHAWNKVKVDGEWYIVDCTWGDTQVAVTTQGLFGSTKISESYELASHYYFLKTDGEMSTHTEDADTAHPKTSAVPYDIYAEIEYAYGADKTFVPYLYDENKIAESAAALATIAFEALTGGTQSFMVNGETTVSDYFAIELYLADSNRVKLYSLLSTVNSAENPIRVALSKKGLNCNIFSSDNRIIVVVSKKVNLV